MLLGPSAVGLQILLNKLIVELRGLSLRVDINKPSCLVFEPNRQVTLREVFLGDEKLDKLSQCVYLVVTSSGSLSLSVDIERTTSAFLRQFNGTYHKFFKSIGFVLNHLLYHM